MMQNEPQYRRAPRKRLPLPDDEDLPLNYNELKFTGEQFLQDKPCMTYEFSHLQRCRECLRGLPEDLSCRFENFRLVKFIGDQIIFRELKKFLPYKKCKIDNATASLVLDECGDCLCDIINEDLISLKSYTGTILCKKTIVGVREICDICATTIFNFHWVCTECGYMLCHSCCKKSKGIFDVYEVCTSSQRPHILTRLKLTRFISGNGLLNIFQLVHFLRYSLGQTCICRKRRHLQSQNTVPTSQLKLSNRNSNIVIISSSSKNMESNLKDEFRNGNPMVVEQATSKLDPALWSPEAFKNTFGDLNVDLIDWKGHKVYNEPMSSFWDDFMKPYNEENGARILKLKDWPPGDDFAKVLPKQQLMNTFPLPDYTRRKGKLNLASYLPQTAIPPDLGPKMYTAFGSIQDPDVGTTNLHVDVSDAVNLLIHVTDPYLSQRDVKKFLAKEVDIPLSMMQRLHCEGEKSKVGALWHIYKADDADKLRSFMAKIMNEKGKRKRKNTDPIHDQVWYLNSQLRARLKREFNVVGYTVLQCEGDAIFIPAGAPHQVRNIRNCLKVAADYVTPYTLRQCLKLTDEFRGLSNNHSNKEDKLQIKNIILYSVKNAVSVYCD